MPEWKEVVGFLCRWALLLVAGATVFLVAWASAVASASVAADLRAVMIVPDAVCVQTKGAHLAGFVSPVTFGRRPELALSNWGDSELLLAASYSSNRVNPRLSVYQPGVNRVRVIGIPYCRHALYKAEAMLQVVQPDEEVCLLDAAAALKARPEDVTGCMAAIKEAHRGDVVFFHNDVAEEFHRVRGQVRERWPNVPVIFSVDRAWKPKTLSYAASALKRDKRDTRKPVVITDDAGLAGIAVGSGFPAHLVTTAAGAKDAEKLRVHESFAKFKEYLKDKPIRH